MKIINGNIWDYQEKGWIVITTNGFVKANGDCVMGRGIALQAKQRFPKLPFELGEHIETFGNNVCVFEDYGIIIFPVKHNWWEKADLILIQKSAIQLKKIIEQREFSNVFMVKPGCENGKLHWNDVEPILDQWLKDTVTIVDWK